MDRLLDGREPGSLFRDSGPVFSIPVAGFRDQHFGCSFLAAQRLDQREGILSVCTDRRIAAEP